MFDEEASDKLLASLEATKLLILGEMHGVKENVDVIYTLFKKFGFRQLALEWKSGLLKVAEYYLESGEIDFDAIKNSPDGRITAGHFALLKKLKDEGLLEKLGWTQDEMRRFTERLSKHLQEAKSGDETPESQARRQQFEEMLKSLDVNKKGTTRTGDKAPQREVNQIESHRAIVPREYRGAYDKFSREITRQKTKPAPQ